MASTEQQLNHRLTVVEHAYHQRLGEDPVEVESSFSRALASDGHLYERHLTAIKEWVPLDCGWVERTSLLIIKNNEGKFLFTNPTPEKIAEIAARIIELSEVGLYNNRWLIPPWRVNACLSYGPEEPASTMPSR